MSTFEFFLAFMLLAFAGFFGVCLDSVHLRLKALEKLLQARPETQEERAAKAIRAPLNPKGVALPKARRPARK